MYQGKRSRGANLDTVYTLQIDMPRVPLPDLVDAYCEFLSIEAVFEVELASDPATVDLLSL